MRRVGFLVLASLIAAAVPANAGPSDWQTPTECLGDGTQSVVADLPAPCRLEAPDSVRDAGPWVQWWGAEVLQGDCAETAAFWCAAWMVQECLPNLDDGVCWTNDDDPVWLGSYVARSATDASGIAASKLSSVLVACSGVFYSLPGLLFILVFCPLEIARQEGWPHVGPVGPAADAALDQLWETGPDMGWLYWFLPS